jgi:hypothetical protein
MGEADGSIMAVIITAHIAQSSSKWGTSHRTVIIHALAPDIGPYMSRAITTIHIHEINGARIRSKSTDKRSCRNADSRSVCNRPSAAGEFTVRCTQFSRFVSRSQKISYSVLSDIEKQTAEIHKFGLYHGLLELMDPTLHYQEMPARSLGDLAPARARNISWLVQYPTIRV